MKAQFNRIRKFKKENFSYATLWAKLFENSKKVFQKYIDETLNSFSCNKETEKIKFRNLYKKLNVHITLSTSNTLVTRVLSLLSLVFSEFYFSIFASVFLLFLEEWTIFKKKWIKNAIENISYHGWSIGKTFPKINEEQWMFIKCPPNEQ